MLSSCFLATGRSCLMHMIGRYSPDHVFMPYMVPDGLINPFERSGIPISHYRLNGALTPDVIDLLGSVTKAGASRPLIVVIHYFGHVSPTREAATLAHEFGGLLLEDCAHCLASPDPRSCGDLTLYSLNKLLPTTDGALMFSKSPECDLTLKIAHMPKLKADALNAYRRHIAACTIMAAAPKADKWFKMAEAQADAAYEEYYAEISTHITPCCPSDEAVKIVHEIDFGKIVEGRRKNAELIAAQLAPRQRFWHDLPIMTFPIWTWDRDQVAERLMDEGIQTGITREHWREPPQDKDEHAAWFWKYHLHLPLNEHMTTADAITIGKTAYACGRGYSGEDWQSEDAQQKPAAI